VYRFACQLDSLPSFRHLLVPGYHLLLLAVPGVGLFDGLFEGFRVVGANDGFLDGERLGLPVVGETLGWKVGSGTGEVLGPGVGCFEGEAVLGLIVGEGVTGERDGLGDGAFFGLSEGDDEGFLDGSGVGDDEGDPKVGSAVGLRLGCGVGFFVGGGLSGSFEQSLNGFQDIVLQQDCTVVYVATQEP
jgi:hypothetical protein